MSSKKNLDEAQRLSLIRKAIEYCCEARDLGMPSSCYAKALREPIYYLWESRFSSDKSKIAAYRSKASVGLQHGSGELVYDHAIPFAVLMEELLAASPMSDDVLSSVLKELCVSVIITKQENSHLNSIGLRSKMPLGWRRGDDPLARYKQAVGIELVANTVVSD